MPKRCSVCEHEQRVEIDFALHRGDPTRLVSERFHLTNATIKGHRRSQHHLVGRTPPRRTSSHTAESMLKKIEACLDDGDALRDLRIAASTLQPEEKRLLVEELRRRAGRGKVAARMAA